MNKKVLVSILIFVLFLTMACGSSNLDKAGIQVNESNSQADISPTKIIESAPTVTKIVEPTITPKPEITIDEQVVLEQDGIKITAKSITFDDFWGPSIKLLIENNSDKSATIQVRDVSVNDVMIETLFSSDVAPGKKANDEITFLVTDLDIANIKKIKNIEFKFHIFDTETWDTIFDSDVVKIVTTVDPTYLQTYDDSGFLTLDKNNIKVITKKLDSANSIWGADVYLYIENNSTDNITIQLRNVSVNGFMIDPIFSCDVVSGKKAFDAITFMESDLTNNDIKKIEELEFNFHVFDSNTWDTIFDSETIKVTFSE